MAMSKSKHPKITVELEVRFPREAGNVAYQRFDENTARIATALKHYEDLLKVRSSKNRIIVVVRNGTVFSVHTDTTAEAVVIDHDAIEAGEDGVGVFDTEPSRNLTSSEVELLEALP